MEKALLPERSTTAATRVKSRSWCSSVRFDSIADCALRRSTLERTVTSRRRQPRWIRAAAAWLAIGATISREQPWERGPLARIPREPRLAARMRASGPRSHPSPTAARVRFGGGGSDGAERSGPSVAQPLLIFEPVPSAPDARGPLQDLLHGRRRGTLFLRSKVANGLTYKLGHWHAEARGLPAQPSLALVVQVDHCSGHLQRDIAFRPRRYRDGKPIGKLGYRPARRAKMRARTPAHHRGPTPPAVADGSEACHYHCESCLAQLSSRIQLARRETETNFSGASVTIKHRQRR